MSSETHNLIAMLKAEGVRKFSVDFGEAEESVKKTKTTVDSFSQSARIAAGILLRDFARGAASAIQEATRLGAQVSTLENRFNRLRITEDAGFITIEKLKEATGGLVSEMDLLAAASEYLQFKLPADKMEETFQAAIKLGQGMGRTARDSIDDVTLALARGSPKILDNLGVTLDLTEAYETYARKLGKTADELSDVEKEMAFQVVASDKVIQRANELGDATSETQARLERFKAEMHDLQVRIGEVLQPISFLTSNMQSLMPVIGTLGAQMIPTLTAKIAAAGGLSGAMGALATAMTGPIGLAVLGVAAVVSLALAYDKWRQSTDEVILAERRLEDAQRKSQEATMAAESLQREYQTTLTSREMAEDQLRQAIKTRSEAVKGLADAELTLIDAEGQLDLAQTNLANTMAWVRGETSSLQLVTEDINWSTSEAARLYDGLGVELGSLQSQIDATKGSLSGLNTEMAGVNSESAQLRLEQLKLRDDFEDGRIGQKSYEKQSEALEGKLRDLQIRQAELQIEIGKTRDTLDTQTDEAENLQDKMGALVSQNDTLVKSQQEVSAATNDVKDKTLSLKEADDALQESLLGLQQRQIETAKAHEQASDAIQEQERAYWSMLAAQNAVEAEKKKRAADQALARMGVDPSFQGIDYAGGQAQGGSYRVTRPTMFIAGEAGPETATFVPQGKSAGGGVSVGNINLYLTGSGYAREDAQKMLDFIVRELQRVGEI